MNTVVTSKEDILQTSRELIRRQGWSAVNIRSVAAACGVSVGSIYNYFDSKAALVSAAVESVWCDIFHFPENPGNKKPFDSFGDCIAWIFDSMKKGDEKYPGFFTFHSMGFMGEEKEDGQQYMAQSWQHIQDRLFMVLLHDENVRQEVFDEDFTRKKFVEIIFSLMISALLQHNYDCSGILGMVRRVIY